MRSDKKVPGRWDSRQAVAIEQAIDRTEKLNGLLLAVHVFDHIVPKIGGIVTGLHVPWNLQVMHWRDNLRKGAARWPDMPETQDELFGEKR